MSVHSHPLRIAIIGAGPGGLTLLNVLTQHGIAATVYERESETEFTSAARLGGSLDLHPDSGQAAMKAAGLWGAFTRASRVDGQEIIASDRTGAPFFHFVPPPGFASRPEIDRVVLRKLLLQNAPEGSIKWGYRFVGATPTAEGESGWEVEFENGERTVVDLLVGADGGRSRVRALVSDVEVAYTGVTGIEGSFQARDHPELAARFGNGSSMALDDCRTIMTQRNGDGRVRVSAMFQSPEGPYVPPPGATPAQVIEDVLSSRFSLDDGWAPWLHEVIKAAAPETVKPRSYYMLPVGFAWAHRAGVTLLGDAMNLMSPFAGAGANVAMLAAAKLAIALGEVKGRPREEVDRRIEEYEREIVEIATGAAAQSLRNMRMFMFGEGDPRAFISSLSEKL